MSRTVNSAAKLGALETVSLDVDNRGQKQHTHKRHHNAVGTLGIVFYYCT